MELDLLHENDTPILQKDHSDILFWTSFLILFSSFYAFSKRRFDAFVICILIFATSLNYWRDPKYGFRRDLDVFVVWSGIFYLFICAIINKVWSPLFWFFYVSTLLLFPIGWYIYNQGYVRLSVLLHCLFHLCGNLSVVIFCSLY